LTIDHGQLSILFLALFISIILLGFNPFLFLDYFVANLIVLQFEISASTQTKHCS